MNYTNFLIGALVGGVVYFILGAAVYGAMFSEQFSMPDSVANAEPNMVYMVISCLAYGGLLSYVFNKWAQISTWRTGAIAGAVISLFVAINFDFFHLSMMNIMTVSDVLLDIVLATVIGGLTGAAVGAVLGMLHKK